MLAQTLLTTQLFKLTLSTTNQTLSRAVLPILLLACSLTACVVAMFLVPPFLLPVLCFVRISLPTSLLCYHHLHSNLSHTLMHLLILCNSQPNLITLLLHLSSLMLSLQHTFTPVDLSGFLGLTYLRTERTFEGVNNVNWDEIMVKTHPAAINTSAPKHQEYDNDFMEDDKQVFNAFTPAHHRKNSQHAYSSHQDVCASMNNPENYTLNASDTSCQYHASQPASALRASVLFTLETFFIKKNAEFKELITQLQADNKALSNKLDRLIVGLYSNNSATAVPQPDMAQPSSAAQFSSAF
ncbi:hypothetical protein DSO57_1023201 [Entomophthora muscae]|uniref:Uncharacterized protein n=1 Tax=Entomophthora muscae TaxID=34485 RepID=A0ACC2U1F1_9FUNG|nr:hypothetical protein DSO57_1023201 [Entomophthora muscae]